MPCHCGADAEGRRRGQERTRTPHPGLHISLARCGWQKPAEIKIKTDRWSSAIGRWIILYMNSERKISRRANRRAVDARRIEVSGLGGPIRCRGKTRRNGEDKESTYRIYLGMFLPKHAVEVTGWGDGGGAGVDRGTLNGLLGERAPAPGAGRRPAAAARGRATSSFLVNPAAPATFADLSVSVPERADHGRRLLSVPTTPRGAQ